MGLVTQGCEGAIKLLGPSPEPTDAAPTGTGGGDGTIVGNTGGGTGGFDVPVGPPRPDDPLLPGDPNLPEDAPREMPSPMSRASRLSRAEYENTVRDLLAEPMTLGITNAFVADSSSTTFNNNGGNLVVTSAEWQDFQTAAEELARQATLTAEALAAVAGVTADPTADPTHTALIRALGRRVYRRPLTDGELAAYVMLAPAATRFYPSMPPRQAVARLVLEAMLQSPHFLYRVELSKDVATDVIPLSASELASRLSYALWQSMPDEPLLRAA